MYLVAHETSLENIHTFNGGTTSNYITNLVSSSLKKPDIKSDSILVLDHPYSALLKLI